MPYRPSDEQLRRARAEYYADNPGSDPQSTYSKVLEYYGADEPYAPHSGSYDYRQKKWQQSLDEGNPDMQWFLPEIPEPDQIAEGAAQFFGVSRPEDPRSGDDVAKAHILNMLSIPTLGFQDELVAGIGSNIPGRGTTYEQELEDARRIQDEASQYQKWFDLPNMLSTGAGVAGSFATLEPFFSLPGKAVQGGRKMMGLAPEASSRAGRWATDTGTFATGLLGLDAVNDMGNADGDLGQRMQAVTEDEDIVPSTVGTIIGASVLGPLMRGGYSKAKKAAQRLSRSGKAAAASKRVAARPVASARPGTPGTDPDIGYPRRPGTPVSPEPVPGRPLVPEPVPMEGVRSDIERALRARGRRR